MKLLQAFKTEYGIKSIAIPLSLLGHLTAKGTPEIGVISSVLVAMTAPVTLPCAFYAHQSHIPFLSAEGLFPFSRLWLQYTPFPSPFQEKHENSFVFCKKLPYRPNTKIRSCCKNHKEIVMPICKKMHMGELFSQKTHLPP